MQESGEDEFSRRSGVTAGDPQTAAEGRRAREGVGTLKGLQGARQTRCVTRKQTLRSLSLSYQKKDGRAWPRPPFFWYDTDF